MTKGEQARLMAWRLRVLRQAADEQNVARVCRRFGLSRKSFYKWKRRHAGHGDAGLCDRPRTPLTTVVHHPVVREKFGPAGGNICYLYRYLTPLRRSRNFWVP